MNTQGGIPYPPPLAGFRRLSHGRAAPRRAAERMEQRPKYRFLGPYARRFVRCSVYLPRAPVRPVRAKRLSKHRRRARDTRGRALSCTHAASSSTFRETVFSVASRTDLYIYIYRSRVSRARAAGRENRKWDPRCRVIFTGVRRCSQVKSQHHTVAERHFRSREKEGARERGETRSCYIPSRSFFSFPRG